MEFLNIAQRANLPPSAFGEDMPTSPPSRTHHFETLHYSKDWNMDLKTETDLGLAPAPWSTSNSMSDGRPNGRPIFDARWKESPMGRARGNKGMVSDPRGLVIANVPPEAAA